MFRTYVNSCLRSSDVSVSCGTGAVARATEAGRRRPGAAHNWSHPSVGAASPGRTLAAQAEPSTPRILFRSASTIRGKWGSTSPHRARSNVALQPGTDTARIWSAGGGATSCAPVRPLLSRYTRAASSAVEVAQRMRMAFQVSTVSWDRVE
ncbi:hypothetical protein ACE1SV_68800 [Streptomyces sp. E-15]